MKKREPTHPIKCIVTVNLSHSADKIFRKSELTRVGMVGLSEEHPEYQPTHMIACLSCSVRF